MLQYFSNIFIFFISVLCLQRTSSGYVMWYLDGESRKIILRVRGFLAFFFFFFYFLIEVQFKNPR